MELDGIEFDFVVVDSLVRACFGVFRLPPRPRRSRRLLGSNRRYRREGNLRVDIGFGFSLLVGSFEIVCGLLFSGGSLSFSDEIHFFNRSVEILLLVVVGVVSEIDLAGDMASGSAERSEGLWCLGSQMRC